MEFIKVEVFVPKDHVWDIIDALNKQQILRDEGYDSVFSQSPVEGHFTPLEGSNPDIGQIGYHTVVEEMKLEFRIDANKKEMIYNLIRDAHPYEVPVINFIGLL